MTSDDFILMDKAVLNEKFPITYDIQNNGKRRKDTISYEIREEIDFAEYPLYEVFSYDVYEGIASDYLGSYPSLYEHYGHIFFDINTVNTIIYNEIVATLRQDIQRLNKMHDNLSSIFQRSTKRKYLKKIEHIQRLLDDAILHGEDFIKPFVTYHTLPDKISIPKECFYEDGTEFYRVHRAMRACNHYIDSVTKVYIKMTHFRHQYETYCHNLSRDPLIAYTIYRKSDNKPIDMIRNGDCVEIKGVFTFNNKLFGTFYVDTKKNLNEYLNKEKMSSLQYINDINSLTIE